MSNCKKRHGYIFRARYGVVCSPSFLSLQNAGLICIAGKRAVERPGKLLAGCAEAKMQIDSRDDWAGIYPVRIGCYRPSRLGK